jgi:uncharacterized protein involved in exopolysaccharide biosynthesis
MKDRNDVTPPNTRKDSEKDDSEISLLDLLCVLAKRKRILAGCFLGFALASLLASLISRPIFKATTTLLPPRASQISASTLAQLSEFNGYSATQDIKNPGDIYVGLLRSRTVVDNVIRHIEPEIQENTREFELLRKHILQSVLDVQSDMKSGIITVAISDKNPVLAARMANDFVTELKRLVEGLAISEAAQRRFFFEEQVSEARASLAGAEDRLKSYQEKNGVMAIDPQTQSMISSIEELRAQVISKKVQLKGLRTYATTGNPDVRRTQAELSGLYLQLSEMERSGRNNHDFLTSVHQIPAAELEYTRLTRNVQFNETLCNLLTKQFEAAKLDEAENALVIQVIDPAVTPRIKDRPKRSLMVVLGSMLGLFVGIFTAFAVEFLENARSDPEASAKLIFVRKELFPWRQS